MKTIWKYKLKVDEQVLDIPKGGQVLTVQVQNGEVCMWVLIDDQAELESRTFFIHGTGHPVKKEAEHYIATFQLYEGSLVFHIFEGMR